MRKAVSAWSRGGAGLLVLGLLLLGSREASAAGTADLELTKRAVVTLDAAGNQTVVYTVVVHNAGPDPATSLVKVTSTTTSTGLFSCTNATDDPAYTDSGTITPGFGSPTLLSTVIWTLFVDLPAGQDWTVKETYLIPAGSAGPATTCSITASGSSDPDPSDNSASIAPTDLVLAETVAVTGSLVLGWTVTYTSTVTNLGPEPVEFVMTSSTTTGSGMFQCVNVLDDPGRVDSATITPGFGTSTSSSSIVASLIGSLEVGGVWTVKQVYVVPTGQPTDLSTTTFHSQSGNGPPTVFLGRPESDTSNDSVTVASIDSVPPALTVAVGRTVLTPATRGLVQAGLLALGIDDVGIASYEVVVYSSEPQGSAPYAPDASMSGTPDTLRLRAERDIPGTGRIYVIAVHAVDVGGNLSPVAVTAVLVPLNLTTTHLATLQARAAVAVAESTGSDGGPPTTGTWTQILP